MQSNSVSGFCQRKDFMKNSDNSQLIGYAFFAIIGAVIIYNFWPFLVGALAVCGLGFLVREYNRNKQ
jgi:hypothetical protein